MWRTSQEYRVLYAPLDIYLYGISALKPEQMVNTEHLANNREFQKTKVPITYTVHYSTTTTLRTCKFISHSVDNLNGFLIECLRLHQTISNWKNNKAETAWINYKRLISMMCVPLFAAAQGKVDLSAVLQ